MEHERDSSLNEVTPDLSEVNFKVELHYLNKLLGLNLSMTQVEECLAKMGFKMGARTEKDFEVPVSPVRSDVLHACDIVEDVGIAFGYNTIPKVFPPTNTTGKQQPIGKFTDLLRHEMAQAGYIECLTMSLLSMKENYTDLNHAINESEVVQLSNPKTIEFEVVRTSLIPGLLKTLNSNKKESLP